MGNHKRPQRRAGGHSLSNPRKSHSLTPRIMPRAIKGALLKCDPPQMAMVRKIDKENNNAYIIEEVDDEVCLVKENKVEEIKAKAKALMDDAMKPTGAMEVDSDKDSDLD